MMKKYITIITLLVASLTSCHERGIETYNSGNYVSFVTELKDSSTFSFLFYLEDIVEYPIKVKVVGVPFEKDTEFKVVANEKYTTLDGKLYELPEVFTFHAGQLEDVIKVKLINDPDLISSEYKLVLDIVDHNQVASVKGIYGRTVIKVSDTAKKPEWWTERPIARYYLGKYSRKKFELFMTATGVGDLTDMPLGDVRILTLKFQHWLDKQEPKVYDEENEEYMATVIIG